MHNDGCKGTRGSQRGEHILYIIITSLERVSYPVGLHCPFLPFPLYAKRCHVCSSLGCESKILCLFRSTDK